MALARQLWLLLFFPIALALVMYGFIAHGDRNRVLMGEASAELRNHATMVEAAIAGAIERGQVETLRRRIEQLAQSDRVLAIAAFDDRGAAILATGHLAAPDKLDLSALARRALEQATDLEEPLDMGGTPALVRTVTFSPRSGEPIVAVIVRDLRYLNALASTLNRQLAVTGAVLLGLMALIVALVSRATVGRPARLLADGAERVAAGDLDIRVPEQGAEELSRLARAFNAMTAGLKDARAQAQREETARMAVERKLQHAQALAAAGQVAASIGHEIGSPLNVILGRARRAAERPGCPEGLQREFETIAAQSERISRFVSRLLDVARPPEPSGSGSDLVQVVQEALSFLGPECRQRRIRTRIEMADAPLYTDLDADRAFQVVFNLCLNAAEAQRDGGEILVRFLSSSAKPGGARKIAFEVEDRGPGVSPELEGHIFEAFFTSKGDRGGSGMGLAIVSGIVREAGGWVEYVPTNHGGACFRVSLPVGVRRLPPPELETRS